MALKFLNKKGWHTGSLANIERVWKKEQVHKEEQRKLEEFKKQIAEEAEKAEFRELQVAAGLVPRQERVDFLYEPGVSKGGSEGFKTLEALPTKAETDAAAAAAATASSKQPGALFEEKPQSANDTWRKLHSDPLLMIKQREQEALARIKNNPVQMAKLKKSVEDKKDKKKKKKEEKQNKHKNAKRDKDIDVRDKLEKYSSEDRSDSEYEEKRKKGHEKFSSSRRGRGRDNRSDSEVEENRERRYNKYSERYVDDDRNMRSRHYGSKKDDSENEERRNRRRYDERRYSSKDYTSEKYATGGDRERDRNEYGSEKYVNGRDGERDRSREKYVRADRKVEPHCSNTRPDSDSEENRKSSIEKTKREMHSPQRTEASNTNMGRPYQKQRRVVTKLSEEEKADRLKEMQMNAVLHEEQRWNRLKKASENDAKEAIQASSVTGPNFLNAAQKSVYGAEKGGSATIEESVRRRKYYSQGSSAANEGNAFRR